ncbi:type II toxin-antitoxin system CcdA family antitoxin [Parvularcula dongshanensis]|uniref:Antitoxin CcdA n=1 Tax=Parvularcula dongshanensis TaxID=1173995 RepID=A0A840I1X5_9PROT|nr:type II toxin-antitoxin system CcdA family antitoxin [Parvularcula dongshanensis]MBB4659016.1 antitoxin CcdA [Parvularcula dongshanensis]
MNIETTARRRPVNLSIREDVIAEAKALSLNASQAAEAGIAAAVKRAKEEAWLRDNAESIKAHNERLARDGLLLRSHWLPRD